MFGPLLLLLAASPFVELNPERRAAAALKRGAEPVVPIAGIVAAAQPPARSTTVPVAPTTPPSPPTTKPNKYGPGNPAVYERIASETDCATLQKDFDTAEANHRRDVERGTPEFAKMGTGFMAAATPRRWLGDRRPPPRPRLPVFWRV